MAMNSDSVARFARHHYRHFNAAALVDAAEGYRQHVDQGGLMFMTLAGAMSTAELGLSLAEMIRNDKVHAICCTGANLEEDVFNLVAHDHYVRIPGYRGLTRDEERDLLVRHLNRVTDTCIPEEEAIRRIEDAILERWQVGRTLPARAGLPHEFLYELLDSGVLESHHQIDPDDSWLMAACRKKLPIIVPGWEDSTLGNIYAAHCMKGDIRNVHTVKSGIQYMMTLADWYRDASRNAGIGFFQIGGGIAGDFPICVVPMLEQDLHHNDIRKWAYFCQISDSTTSYGSYSGAVPNEKITWGKLDVATPSYIIESDATIVAPLIFAMVLEG